MKGRGKPRYRFCWHCNSKLWGNEHHILETDGGEILVHATCAREMKLTGEAWEPTN